MTMKKIFLIVMCLLLASVPVFANSMAPTSIPGKAGVFVDKESGVELVKETIRVNIDEKLEKTQYIVEYHFKNVSSGPIETPIWFFKKGYSNSYDFEVYVNNKEVKSKPVDLALNEIVNWSPKEDYEFIDPLTNSGFDSGVYKYSGQEIFVSEFILEMEQLQEVIVLVEYEVWNGYISNRVTDYIYDIKLSSYMLSPATFYEGSGPVDIIINTPPKTILKSNLEMTKLDGQTYEVKDYNLKSTEDLYLSFTRKPGITELFAQDKIGFRIRLLALQILILLGFVRSKDKKLRRRMKWILIASIYIHLRTAGYAVMYLFWILIPLTLFLLYKYSVEMIADTKS